MTNKEWKRRMTYEALVILGMLALLLYVCRIWPILLLVILGIFAGALRLVFLSSPKVQPIRPEQPASVSPEPQRAVTKREAADEEDSLSFGELQTRITRWVREEYPHARWVWKYPKRQSAVPARGGQWPSCSTGQGDTGRRRFTYRGKRLFEIRYLSPPAGKPQLGAAGRPRPPPRGAGPRGRGRAAARSFSAGGFQPHCL